MTGVTFQQAWERTLRRAADRCAITAAADGRRVTFAELEAGAAAWAARNPVPGGLSGRAVAFGIPNSALWFEVFLGLTRQGAVVLPLDANEPPGAQRRMAEGAGALFWWNGDALESLGDGRCFASDAALIKLTSGSTGKPRALVFSAAQMLADGRQVAATMGITSRDVNYGLIPLGHSYGLGNLTVPLVARGVPIVLGSVPLPHAIAADFERWRPTVFPSVPAVWRALVAAQLPPAALASLRVAISAGAPLPPDVARSFVARYGRPLHNFYGSSETGGIAYDRTGAATLAGGVGRALRGVRIEPARAGRIVVSSAAVFTRGNRRRTHDVGSWFPPDRVSVDAKGSLTVLGRTGTVVKIGGRRVDLAEVTARLRQLESVRDVWVGVSAGAEPVIGAALATSRTVPDLRAALQRDTAPWKIPKRWAVLAELPLTARGKTDAAAVRQRVFG